MGKYCIKRIVGGLISLVLIVTLVNVLVYGLTDKNDIFMGDSVYSKKASNEAITYKYERWQAYGYLDYLRYDDFLNELVESGELTSEKRNEAAALGETADADGVVAAEYVKAFQERCLTDGYTVVRLDADVQAGKTRKGGDAALFAYKNISTLKRLWLFFSHLVEIDSIYYVKNDEDLIGGRHLSFTWYDAMVVGNARAHDMEGNIVDIGTEKVFSPAIMGNGTKHKYLLYCDNRFPYVHQNIIRIHLGESFAVSKGVDAFDAMTMSQGSNCLRKVVYPTGLMEETSDDLHRATYAQNADLDMDYYKLRFNDNYTDVPALKRSASRMGLSFGIGIVAASLAYLFGVPMGIAMARSKGKLFDKLATAFIIFISAVPTLAYIFIVRAFGMEAGLAGRFDIDANGWGQYVLPVISLALPAMAGLMRWLRRYMVEQMNNDYVKFARANGLSERKIFGKHIFKNAAIPLLHKLPATVLGTLVGAVITETVFAVPGTGRMLTTAITLKDNAVIVGLTAFYACLSIVSLLLGDLLMAVTDKRISFANKAR